MIIRIIKKCIPDEGEKRPSQATRMQFVWVLLIIGYLLSREVSGHVGKPCQSIFHHLTNVPEEDLLVISKRRITINRVYTDNPTESRMI